MKMLIKICGQRNWLQAAKTDIIEESLGEGKDYPLQYFGLENVMDCIVHGVAKSWTRLSDFHTRLICQADKQIGLKNVLLEWTDE